MRNLDAVPATITSNAKISQNKSLNRMSAFAFGDSMDWEHFFPTQLIWGSLKTQIKRAVIS